MSEWSAKFGEVANGTRGGILRKARIGVLEDMCCTGFCKVWACACGLKWLFKWCCVGVGRGIIWVSSG